MVISETRLEGDMYGRVNVDMKFTVRKISHTLRDLVASDY